jgi:hypothetical protein
MNNIEGDGFVIKDKRSFDESGELKEEQEEKEQAPGEKTEPEKPEEEAKSETQERGPLPEVNFQSLIFSLSSSALFHLGEIADPQTGQKQKDLPLAKHSIDTIALLKEKTKGNLEDEEQKFLDNILTDLRWRYVKATG